jgi:hypothetical protein
MVEDCLEVLAHILVRVGSWIGRRRRASVPSGVERDHTVAGALKRPGAHDDVAPRRGQTMQEDDGEPLARVGHGQCDPGPFDLILGCLRS